MPEVAEQLPDLDQVRHHVRQQRVELGALGHQVHVDPGRELTQRPVHLQPGRGEVHHVRAGRVHVSAQKLVRDGVGRVLRRLERVAQAEDVARRLIDHRRGGFGGPVHGLEPEADLLDHPLVQDERPGSSGDSGRDGHGEQLGAAGDDPVQRLPRQPVTPGGRNPRVRLRCGLQGRIPGRVCGGCRFQVRDGHGVGCVDSAPLGRVQRGELGRSIGRVVARCVYRRRGLRVGPGRVPGGACRSALSRGGLGCLRRLAAHGLVEHLDRCEEFQVHVAGALGRVDHEIKTGNVAADIGLEIFFDGWEVHFRFPPDIQIYLRHGQELSTWVRLRQACACRPHVL